MDKIEIACLVFESIKQNWSKNGCFQSLVDTICQRLNIPVSQEIYEKLRKADALWLNNHLEEPDHEEDPEEKLEVIDNQTNTKEIMAKSLLSRVQKKDHNYH